MDFHDHLLGRKLYGDDFTPDEITEWHRDEKEAYAALGSFDRESYEYVYHELNKLHGFSKLPSMRIRHALGIGSAYGEEFLPIINHIERISILDPSDSFVIDRIENVPVDFRKPNESGIIPFDDNQFDLVTCLGVLHHIPNVSFVVSEMGRVLANGGFALVREPVVNMGDWRRPRPRLTKRERGIPRHLMEEAFRVPNLKIVSSDPCMFPPLSRLLFKFGQKKCYSSASLTRLDSYISRAFEWNSAYHRPNLLNKFAPACVFWVVTKQRDQVSWHGAVGQNGVLP